MECEVPEGPLPAPGVASHTEPPIELIDSEMGSLLRLLTQARSARVSPWTRAEPIRRHGLVLLV